MKKLQKIIAVIALVAAIFALAAGCEEEKPQAGTKHVTVTVTYDDGHTKDFTYDTEESYLGPLLRNQELVTGHEDAGSFFIDGVDGLVADYSVNESWWKVLENGEQVLVGVDEIALKDGGTYQLVYTIGF